jgi:hypothetical protein
LFLCFWSPAPDDSAPQAAIRSQIGKDHRGFPQREAWDDFATNMWRSYRARG